MYIAAIVLLMLVLPLISVAAQTSMLPDAAALMGLVGKWFTFWGVGVRLFLAGLNQVFRPHFTAEDVFGIGDPAAHGLVREIGFGNLAMGTLGILSLFFPDFLLPAAIVGGLFFGLAGLGHLVRKDRSLKEQVAFVSDLAIFALLAAFVAAAWFESRNPVTLRSQNCDCGDCWIARSSWVMTMMVLSTPQ